MEETGFEAEGSWDWRFLPILPQVQKLFGSLPGCERSDGQANWQAGSLPHDEKTCENQIFWYFWKNLADVEHF